MTDPDQVPPPAGWYPDADSRDLIRWWNGASWSDHVRPAPTSAQPAAESRGPIGDDAPADTTEVPRVPLAPEPLTAPAADPWPGSASPWQQQPSAAWTPPGVVHPYATNPAATVSLVLGIVAIVLFFTFLPNIAAVVLGIIGLDRSGRARQAGLGPVGRGHALAGLILGGVALIIPILVFVLLAVFAAQQDFS